MKVYNISDTKGFFDKLSGCKGNVELVSNDGIHITINEMDNRDTLDMLMQTYGKGLFSEMELNFLKPSDAAMMCDYLAGEKAA